MKSNKICNPKKEVPETIALNDEDYMTSLLSTLKEMEKNMAISLTESSNSELYKEYKTMFENICKLQRAAYELMFKFGWYTLEEAGANKITTLGNDLQTILDTLNN